MVKCIVKPLLKQHFPSSYLFPNSYLFKTNCSATKVGQQGSIRRPKFKRYTNIIKFFFGKSALKGKNEGWRKKKREQEEEKKRKRKKDRTGKDNQVQTNQEEITVKSRVTLRAEPLKFEKDYLSQIPNV